MSVQVYGQVHDYASFSNVTRAFLTELKRARVGTTIYGTQQLSPRYVDCPVPVGLNNAARIGIFVGYPESAVGWLNGHKHKVLVTVCETDRIPSTWVDACNGADLIVVPSTWCETAFRSSGVRKDIMVVPHGLWLENLRIAKPPIGKTVFLHVSGALSFASRKGTNQLLLAFKKFLKEVDPSASLVLRMPETPGVLKVVREELGFKESEVVVDGGRSLSPGMMNRYFDNFDAVVQPSRAEGFGLIPLEARAAGVPAIMTFCTGHEEHAAPGIDVQVRHRRLLPLVTQANSVGSAPVVAVSDVYNALVAFHNDKNKYRERAQGWDARRKWLWNLTLKDFTVYIKNENRGEKRKIYLGAGASLRGA